MRKIRQTSSETASVHSDFLHNRTRNVERRLSVGEVDSVTGTLIGRPKSATFRTLDVVGLDTFYHMLQTTFTTMLKAKKKKVFEVPDFIQKMIENGWLGAKAKQGFYKKEGKGDVILELILKRWNMSHVKN